MRQDVWCDIKECPYWQERNPGQPTGQCTAEELEISYPDFITSERYPICMTGRYASEGEV